jgi:hypothetical protein
MFKLSIPQPEMLQPNDLVSILAAMKRPGTTKVEMRTISESIREGMNPHPSGQKEENVPRLDGVPVPGLQHKYRETVLFFPSEVGQRPNTVGHTSSYETSGSVLSRILHLLFQMGAVFVRRL